MTTFIIPLACLFAACGFTGVSCGCEWFAEHLPGLEDDDLPYFDEAVHWMSALFAGLAILAVVVGLIGWPLWAMVRGMVAPL